MITLEAMTGQLIALLREDGRAVLDTRELCLNDYAETSWRSRRQKDDVERTPGWFGYLIDGIPTLLVACDFDAEKDLLNTVQKQAHIARSYLMKNQTIDLHVLVLIRCGNREQLANKTRYQLEDDGKLARKCVAVIPKSANDDALQDALKGLIARSPFNTAFAKTVHSDASESAFLDWEAELGSSIETWTKKEIDRKAVKEAMLMHIRDVLAERDTVFETWPDRLSAAMTSDE